MNLPISRRLEGALVRWAILAGTGLWLTAPLFTARNLGTGDAIWNALTLGDAVTQFRAGVFPVYVGQSAYQFNGSVYPFRVAPYYPYLGGLLDLATGRKLDFVTLEHLTAAVSLVGGLISAYLCLNWLAPRRKWTSLALAVLYASCPGVMGLVYAQDLYMSTMAVPWVPVALAGVVKAYEEPGRRPLVVAGAGLAALWWAHAPIALWTSIAMALLGLPLAGRWARNRRPAIAGAVTFGLLGAYPFVSAMLLRERGEKIVPYVMDRAMLVGEIAHAFPACILPIDPKAPLLTHMQVGYGLWLSLGLAALLGAVGGRKPALWILSGFSLLLLALLYPVPWLNAALWRSLPESLVGLTLYWPMQRLCIVFAGTAVVAAQLAIGRTREAGRLGRFAARLLALACIWSVYQSGVMLGQARENAETVEATAILLRPENAAIQRHSYHLFPSYPDTMSQGVMDPAMESRLLKADGSILATNFDGVPKPDRVFEGHRDENPGILDLDPPLVLEPGRRYALTFGFRPDRRYDGVLQLVGAHTFREYLLPEAGEKLAFGLGVGRPKSLSLWTTASKPEEVRLRFIPTGEGEHAADYLPFADYSLAEMKPERMPVELKTLIPYRAVVRSPAPAVLETPRLFVPGYTATLDGHIAKVFRSARGFAAIAVPAGRSEAVVSFVGPPLLRLSFWASILGWSAAAAIALWAAVTRIRGARLPAEKPLA